jgi:hypothetical protein
MLTMNIFLRVQRFANDEPHAMEGASPSPSQAQDCQKANADVCRLCESAAFAA